MKKIILLVCSSLLSLTAYAVDVPTSAEAKKVLDFYYQGQGQGVVLVDNKLCLEIDKEGDNKNNCADTLDAASVKTDQEINFWMAFLVPNNEEAQSIIVQFEHNGIARIVKNMKVTGSIRYRTWRKVKLNKSGDWTVKIIHDKGDDVKLINTVNITVSEAAAETTAAPEPAAAQ